MNNYMKKNTQYEKKCTIQTRFALGDRVVVTYPHTVKTKVASFPDWEEKVVECSGIHVVTICQITVSRDRGFFGGTHYRFCNATPCACGKTDAGNAIVEDSACIVGLESEVSR